MVYTREGVLEFIQANDVKFIRLLFCDMQGAPKNVAVMADYLSQVFEVGASFDASVLGESKHLDGKRLFLRPDPATLAVLPWRPQSGRAARIYCDVVDQNNDPFEGDGRGLLRTMRQRVLDKGLFIKTSLECEFYLFELDEEALPTFTPHDTAGYLDIAPFDRCENARRDICLTLEELGMSPMGSHHEKGPGQNNIWCRNTDVFTCADDIITYKTVVRTIAAQHGLFASFMSRPLADKPDSSLFLGFSLEKALGSTEKVPDETLRSFAAGIMNRLHEITLFLQPTTNAYARLAKIDASSFLNWDCAAPHKRARIPYESNTTNSVELGGLDALCNPYYALSLLLAAGVEGIECKTTLDEVIKRVQKEGSTLPANLGKAIEEARTSRFIARYLPLDTIEHICDLKKKEWDGYRNAEDRLSFEQSRYFAQM